MKDSDLLEEYAKYNDEDKVLNLGNHMQGKIRTKNGVLAGLMGFSSLFTGAIIAGLVSTLLLASPIIPAVIALSALAFIGVVSMSYLGIKQLQNKREYVRQSKVIKNLLIKKIEGKKNKTLVKSQNRMYERPLATDYNLFTRTAVSRTPPDRTPIRSVNCRNLTPKTKHTTKKSFKVR